MMRIKKFTDYGIRILVHICQYQKKGPMSARQISDDLHIPLPTVSKLLKRLTRMNVVTSSRGPKGGHLLARPSEKISLNSVISLLEGPVAFTDCLSSSGRCQIQKNCPVQKYWRKIKSAVEQTLEDLTLEKIAS
jgi:FeS assembly SUF system regulator